MRRDKLKLLTAVILFSLFAIAGCQYLKSDFSEGAFPLKKGAQWVYLETYSGDTIIIEVGRTVAKYFINSHGYGGLLYDCNQDKMIIPSGYIIGKKIKLKKGMFFPFNFVVQNENCYNFINYSGKGGIGSTLYLYGKFGYKSKINDTVFANTIDVPTPVIYSYKPEIGFTEIKIGDEHYKLINYKP